MKFKLPVVNQNIVPVTEEPQTHDAEAPATETGNEKTEVTKERDSDGDGDIVTPGFQHGVQSAQAMTHVWTKNHLILAYVLIWIIQFIQTFSSGITNTLTPYVTSSFAEHSLTATTSIISSLIGGLVKLPYAKLIDVWGRPQVCFIAFASSPYIATVWAYGPAAQSILNTIGFRWGFGIWAIIVPLVSTPLFALFYYNQKKAEKAGLVSKLDSGRTWTESVIYYCREFDVLGLLLISTGLALFLLSFSLYSYQANEWRSPLIICFLIFGGLLIIAFVLYEKYLAPVTFIPWNLLRNRTVIFTYTMAFSIYLAWYLWDSYFYSFLIVVFNESVSHATYITNIYTIGSCFWSIIMGIIIRYNGRLKWQALFFGVPITILGVALMIKFRQPDTNIGYIVMCQIFIAFGGGTLVICEQMTVMAVSSHQHIPAVLAMEGMVANIGSSVGSTIAAAMWTGIFPKKLAAFLPADAQGDLASIYGSLTVQSSYAVGSPTRDAINRAYGDTQRLMLIAATCLYSITLGSTMLWKEVNVKDIKQVRGLVM